MLDEKVDQLIKDLDKLGRSFDQYEFGLPTYDEKTMSEMRDHIKHWLDGVIDEHSRLSESCRRGHDDDQFCGQTGVCKWCFTKA